MFRKTRRLVEPGFSLLEVVLAVGVLSLAVIALVGVVGPLLRGMAEDQIGGDLEPLFAEIRQWSSEQARMDYTQFRDGLRSGRVGYAYKIEAGTTLTDAGWRVTDAADFSRELATGSASRFVRGPVACYLEFASLGANSTDYEPFTIKIWKGGLPDPETSLQDWTSVLLDRNPDYSIRYVVHR